jgi:hypothetical protein
MPHQGGKALICIEDQPILKTIPEDANLGVLEDIAKLRLALSQR